MYKYEGLVVHQSQDEHGVIEVVDKQGERALHFGSSSRQSSMLLAEPDRLHSFYARTMMACLLFQQQPEDVLMIGLGGGTIAKFLLHQFPACQLKVVEFRAAVLKVARSHFALPFDARLKVKIGCGAQHVRVESAEHSAAYGLMMIDAYDHAGMAPEVSSAAFFDHCKQLLKPDGVLVINLWGTDKALFQQVSWNMGLAFDQRLLFLPVRKRGNIIGFAFGEAVPRFSMKALIETAKRLEQQYQIEYPVFVQDLKRNNPRVLTRMVGV
jgi:spermidine synthase